jgi:hypothetical protein
VDESMLGYYSILFQYGSPVCSIGGRLIVFISL